MLPVDGAPISSYPRRRYLFVLPASHYKKIDVNVDVCTSISSKFTAKRQGSVADRGSLRVALQLFEQSYRGTEDLPLDYCDKGWLTVQKHCGIKTVDWAQFRYAAALVESGMFLQFQVHSNW